ncbi:MAG: substrate-binding domain-containing protein [Rhodobiaceae bacterium]|nr:substrate-binding domain-containing protein [Rhodobiaceae bacterium]
MDLKILSGGAANGLVTALTPAFTAATGMGIAGDFGAVGGMRDRILDGEAVDIVILTRAIIDGLAKAGHVDPVTVADVGTVVTGVAVKEGKPQADVSSAAALAEALRGADVIYAPDMVKSTAGIHFARVLDSLGVADVVADRLRSFPNGQTAMAAMAAADDASALGCTQITEILNTPGVSYCGALPDPHGLKTVYTAAIGARSDARDAVATLIGLLTAPENAGIRASAGFA